MKVFQPEQFVGERPWAALDIERFEDATVRLHWTDAPFDWHVNDGPEIFVVLDGTVDMRVRGPGGETVHRLQKGHVAHMDDGEEHVAEPLGQARVLVIERAGSV